MANTGDPRGVPLLRAVPLKSPNFMMVKLAADGLAQAKDKDSVPLIIDACKRALASAAELLAESLVYFDDPDAQKAVDQYVTPKTAKIFRVARANGTQTAPFW